MRLRSQITWKHLDLTSRILRDTIGQDRLTGNGRPRDRFARDKLAPGWGPQIRACWRSNVACSSPIGPNSPTTVFCKSKSRFRNCSLPPTRPDFVGCRNNVRLRLRSGQTSAGGASSGLLNPDLTIFFLLRR